MAGPAKQLALNVHLRDGATFETYYAGPNQTAVASVAAMAQPGDKRGGEQQIYLWGADTTGKSHLLQAACHAMAGRGLSSVYIPLSEFAADQASVLEDMGTVMLVCVDELDSVIGKEVWERALFNLINSSRQAGHHLLLSSRQNPTALNIALPDLASRLVWGPVFHLQALDDHDKLEVLRLRAKARGFELPDEAARYLLTNCPRDMQSLNQVLDKLDTASLEAQRRITIPFIKTVLGF